LNVMELVSGFFLFFFFQIKIEFKEWIVIQISSNLFFLFLCFRILMMILYKFVSSTDCFIAR
jgi:hypothetical protein